MARFVRITPAPSAVAGARDRAGGSVTTHGRDGWWCDPSLRPLRARPLDGAGGEPGCPSPPCPQGPARGRHARAYCSGLWVRRARRCESGERRGDRAPAVRALGDSGRGAPRVCTRVPGGSHQRRSRCLGSWVGSDGRGREDDDQGERSGDDRRAPAQATGDDQRHMHAPQAVPGAPLVMRRTA